MKKNIIIFALIFSIVIIFTGCSERAGSCVIKFETNGGSAVAERESTVESFPVSRKDGYRIEGWYEDKNFTERADFPYAATENVTLYAKWTSLENGSEKIVYERTEDGKGFIAVSYSEKSFSVCIPDKHMGLPVVEIKEGFLKNRAYVYVLCIGKNVNKIEEKFYRCVMLNQFEVDGENPRYSVKAGALYDSEKNEIYAYPRNLKTEEYSVDCGVNKDAFLYNSTIERLTLGENAKAEVGVFNEMSALQSITVDGNNRYFSSENGNLYSKDKTIFYKYPQGKSEDIFILPDTVVRVEDGAFGYSGIKEIVLGVNVEDYDDYSSTPMLEKFTVKDGNKFYKSVGGVLYSADGKILYRYPCAKSGDYRIENGTEIIYAFSFAESGGLTSVIIPATVKDISGYAFYYCTRLRDIEFEEESGVESIENGAFTGCESLSELTLTSRRPPETDESVFDDVKAGFRIVIPSNGEELYEYFWGFAKKYFAAEGRALVTYTVTYETDGGEGTESYHGVFVKDEPIPTKEGRVFQGWYDNAELLGFKIEFPLIIENHITLYADWGYSGIEGGS